MIIHQPHTRLSIWFITFPIAFIIEISSLSQSEIPAGLQKYQQERTDTGNMCCTPLYVTLFSCDYYVDYTGIFRMMQQKIFYISI